LILSGLKKSFDQPARGADHWGVDVKA
jgi:hypothetical protein